MPEVNGIALDIERRERRAREYHANGIAALFDRALENFVLEEDGVGFVQNAAIFTIYPAAIRQVAQSKRPMTEAGLMSSFRHIARRIEEEVPDLLTRVRKEGRGTVSKKEIARPVGQRNHSVWPYAGNRQSIGARPTLSRNAFAFEKCLHPKNPLCADSGEGCGAFSRQCRPPFSALCTKPAFFCA